VKPVAFPMKASILPIALLFSVVIFQDYLFAKEEPLPHHTYAVIIPHDVPLNNLRIEYFLMDGSGAGIHGILEHTGEDHKFIIPTDINGKDATGLDVVFFCPGYHTVTIYEPSLAFSKRELIVTMEKLPMIHLVGQIADYKPLPVRDPVVNITFSGMVGLPHWDIWEGRNQAFKIAKTPLLANGSFSVEIPDFLHDKSFPSGHMTVTVQTKDGSNPLLRLSPDPEDASSRLGYFKPRKTYDPIVTFYGYKGFPR